MHSVEACAMLCRRKYEAGAAARQHWAICDGWRIRRIIERLYNTLNPTKVAELPRIFAKYAGQERELYRTVCEVYGVEPEDFVWQ